MANTLNFNNVKKRYLTVTLADEKKTTLMIGTPTKAILDEMESLQGAIEEFNDDTSSEALDSVYLLCARLMSRNKGGIKITKENLEEIFDFEDIVIFFNAYISFVHEVTRTKN
jgi:hypothetical protein